MTYKIGSIGNFKRWTQQVVRDPAAAQGVPKQWFDSEETARAAGHVNISAEAVVKLLSPENVRLLHVIGRERPASVQRLAELVGRKQSNVSRTLKKLEKAGIVRLVAGAGRERTPQLTARRVRLEIDLTGAEDAVSIEAAG
jgi:predicted transcriptional regulator